MKLQIASFHLTTSYNKNEVNIRPISRAYVQMLLVIFQPPFTPSWCLCYTFQDANGKKKRDIFQNRLPANEAGNRLKINRKAIFHSAPKYMAPNLRTFASLTVLMPLNVV